MKIYYPSCKECDGVLNIKIQPLNFSINFECEKDKSHNKNNIYFKTFERFYLKERNLITCSKCHIILENSKFFNCEKCKCIYCCDCYIEDIQINGHKNIVNNKNKNRCDIHNHDLTLYCFNCLKKICIFCLKNGEHNNHNTKGFAEIMPSSSDIENLQNRIKQKSDYTNYLIKKINDWKIAINKKVEELKQNLMDEKALFEKMILNFNNNFINYTYFQNFNYMNKNILNISNNQYLLEFLNTENFESKTQILMEIFKIIGKKITNNEENKKERIININNQNQNRYSLIEKINDYYFVNTLNDNTIHLSYYDEKQNNIISCKNIILNENLYSISLSSIENKIFISSSNQKKIKIIDYDIEQNIFKLNSKEITINNNIFNNNNYFYKCIQLSKEFIATSDNQNITIWKDNTNNFIQIKNIILNTPTSDMILIDNENFISTHSKEKVLRIFEINNFKQIKIINKIDCINNTNCLFKINDKFIAINCFKGIGLLFIKTKEIIQYIQTFSLLNQYQKICFDKKENIYILNIINNINLNNNSNVFSKVVETNQNPFSNNKAQTNNSLFTFSNTLNNNNSKNYKIQIIKAKISDGAFDIIKKYEILYYYENINNVIYYPEDNFVLFGYNNDNSFISL